MRIPTARPHLILAMAALLLATAGCKKPPVTPDHAIVVPPPPSVAPLPLPDLAAAEARIAPENTLTPLSFFRDSSTTVQGTVAGYKAPAYVVPVAAGQTLTVVLESPGANLYFNVVDAKDASGAAVFRGEVDGPSASLKVASDATYLILPFQPRAMARRGESSVFQIEIGRK